MHNFNLFREHRGAVTGFVLTILAVGSLRFVLTLLDVPDRITTYSSITLVILVGLIYFAFACPKWRDRLLAAYLLFVPYTFVEVVTLGYTWVTGRFTIFHRHEHAFGLTVGQHLTAMVIQGLTSGPLVSFLLMSIIAWAHLKVRLGARTSGSGYSNDNESVTTSESSSSR